MWLGLCSFLTKINNNKQGVQPSAFPVLMQKYLEQKKHSVNLASTEHLTSFPELWGGGEKRKRNEK